MLYIYIFKLPASSANMKAIVLCAGKGERMRPLTDRTPKPMLPINHKPVLEYIINLCRKYDIKQIAVNTSYMPEKIRAYFGDGSRFGVSIRYSLERDLLGTAGALNNFRDFLNEPFFVIYGDNITDLNLQAMRKAHKEKNATATMFVYQGEKQMDANTTPGCVVLDDSSFVKEIIERPNEQEKEYLSGIPESRKMINGGIYLFEPEVFRYIPKGRSDFALDILPAILKNRAIYGFRFPCYFKEVGQMMRYLKAKEEIERGDVKLNI
jgi:NDP-sugar pyrophosphorylase family protein